MFELGVCVDSSLSFCVHINNIVVRVKQRANLLLKCFLSKDSSVLTKAFIVYVRPILEYCSSVWSPSTVGNVAFRPLVELVAMFAVTTQGLSLIHI